MSEPDVKRLQEILVQQGFLKPEDVTGSFSDKTLSAVLYFQNTHRNAKGEELKPDGIVGPETWWALEHPSGAAQRIGTILRVPEGLTPQRASVLHFCAEQRALNVHEVPDGSNDSPEIRLYGPPFKVAWCMKFASYALYQAKVIAFTEASTWTFWKWAERKGIFYPAFSKNPRALVPGNIVLWQHKDGNGNWTRLGHAGVVFSVSPGGVLFNTIEGNHGNAVASVVRRIGERNLIGFVNPYSSNEQVSQFERVLFGR
jgi:hypothetical protein